MRTRILLWRYGRGHRNFTGSALAQTNLSKQRLPFIILSQADLQGANLNQTHLAGAELIYTNLRRTQLMETNLIGANLLAANLQRANLARAHLCGALLNAVDFSDAILDDASLTGADLRAANLEGASLKNANLRGTNFKAANLAEADLTGADLTGADLTGAILPDQGGKTYRSRIPIVDTDPTAPTLPEDFQSFQLISPQEISPAPTQPSIGTSRQTMANHRIMADNDVQLQGSDTETGADSRAAEQSWSGTLHQPLHQSLGHAFQPQDSQEAQGRLLRAILVRKGQAQLRRTLLRAYGERCAISRCGVAQVLEVAYILPFSHHKTNHPSNTLLLRSDLHLLFDLHLLTIDPETLTVLIAPGLAHSCYGTMAGRTIYWPSVDEYEPDLEALAQHKALCAWHQQEESAWSEAYSF